MKLNSPYPATSLQFLKGLLLAVLLFVASGTYAFTRTSVASGNWDNAAIWSPAGVPTSSDNVTIGTGHTITVASDAFVHHLIINASATLKVGSGKRISISGNTQILGTFNTNKGYVTLSAPGLSVAIASTGTLIWDPAVNTEAEATIFTRGAESFDPSSTLIIKKWYNYTIPIGSVVNGNFGNLEINSIGGTNSIVEWDQQNYFETHRIKGTLTIDMGWITLDKTGTINSTYIGALVLKNVNSTFYAHNGTHPSAFTLTIGSVTNNGGTFYGLNDGNGNVNVYITGNFTNSGNVKIINNSGVSNVSNGNASLNVDGVFSQSTGDTRILYNIATTNSGVMNATFGDLTVNGGIFMGQTACHTAGGTGSFTVIRNLTINFQNSTDKFRGTSLTSISSAVNNLKFNLTVNGNVSISGINSAEFTSSASQGEENIKIYGNLSIGGCTDNFNYGTLTASHPANVMVRGTVSVTNGSLYLSRNNGMLDASLGSVCVYGGTMSLKNGTGAANVIVNGAYRQNNGLLYFHNNSGSSSTDELHMYVNGNFAQTGGKILFDDYPTQTISKAVLHLMGDSCTFAGTGSISNAGEGNSSALATIKYDKVGTIIYTRTGTTQSIDQTVQQIESACNVSVRDCQFQISSHNQTGVTTLKVSNGGRLSLNNGQIASNEHYGFSNVLADSGSTISTTKSTGLYDGTTSAALRQSTGFTFYLHPYSIVEYNSNGYQTVTGLTSTNSPVSAKYGILRINIQGDSIGRAMLNSSKVYVRTMLDMKRGGLSLNGNTLTIENGTANAIQRDKGFIISEGNSTATCGIVNWKNISSGEHIFPFGISPSYYIPVYIKPVSGLGNSISISTRSTPKDNLPYPDQSISFPGGNTFANEQVLDRWWTFTAPGVKADVTIFYCGSENTVIHNGKFTKLNIAQWTGSGWNSSALSVTGTTTGIGYLKVAGTTLNSSWTAIISQSDPSVDLTASLQPSTVAVNWKNQADEEVNYYELERSTDGVNFSTVVRKQATSNSMYSYKYDDIEYPQTPTYYRIRMILNDGTTSYSKRVLVDPAKNSPENMLSISAVAPNPFTSILKFSCQSPTDQYLMMTIWSVDGKLALSKQLEARKGSQDFEITEAESLPAGSYILRISGGNQNTTKNIIKN